MLVCLTAQDKQDAVIEGTITSVRGIYKFSLDIDTFIHATVCAGRQKGQRSNLKRLENLADLNFI